jgi:hypothetical protein
MSRYDAGAIVARSIQDGMARTSRWRALLPTRRQERFARFTNPAIKVR